MFGYDLEEYGNVMFTLFTLNTYHMPDFQTSFDTQDGNVIQFARLHLTVTSGRGMPLFPAVISTMYLIASSYTGQTQCSDFQWSYASL